MNEHYYKIKFAARLIPRAAKIICIRGKKLNEVSNQLVAYFNNLF